mmetsp:Transcript_10820/g.19755  ORF Transcript_10820/g.19755 Transcript_10820/m.19755 type:complete len:393 (+) Transcript_10820:129-1307(+)
MSDKMKSGKAGQMIGYLALVVLVFQNASVPLMARYARTAQSVKYCVPLLVLIQEVIKLVCSVLLLGQEVSFSKLGSTIDSEILMKPSMTLRLAVPAALFFLQNNCQQLANTYLPAAVFQVTYQSKTLIVAILSVIMLGRRLERFKWLGIAGLAVGVGLVQSSKSSDDKSKDADPYTLMVGLGYVLTAACCSGFANVYFEKMVKHNGKSSNIAETKKPSVWVRNIQLAMFTIGLALPVVFFSSDFEMLDPWRGFTPWVVALGFNNSLGGLLVAVIVKYANNILKGFSNALSTVLATLISIPLFGFKTGMPFSFGVVLVIWSTLVYGRLIKFESPWWNTVILETASPPSTNQVKDIELSPVRLSESRTRASKSHGDIKQLDENMSPFKKKVDFP